MASLHTAVMVTVGEHTAGVTVTILLARRATVPRAAIMTAPIYIMIARGMAEASVEGIMSPLQQQGQVGCVLGEVECHRAGLT